MTDLSQDLIRYIIKKRRKEKNLRLEDLKDRNISIATISFIENGEQRVSQEKLHYLLTKLNIDPASLKHLIAEEAERIEELRFQLDFIEALLDNNETTIIYDLLLGTKLEDFHPLAPHFHYLMGLAHLKKQEWHKAEHFFQRAILLCRHHSLNPSDNIIALCLKELSTCAYHQNDLDQALSFVNQGLEAFQADKERKEVRYILLSNKILYLLRAGQTEQASHLLNQIWPLIQEIELTRVTLNLYKFRAILLRKSKMFSEAIACCKEGIRKGKKNLFLSRTYDLLNVLGSIYLQQKAYGKAAYYFELVINNDKDVKFPRRHIDAHTYLAILHDGQQNWNKAEKHLEQAIELGKKLNDAYRITKAYIVRGNSLKNQLHYDDAVTSYKQAMILAQNHHYKSMEAKALYLMAECYDKMKEEKEFTDSTNLLFFLLKELNFKEDEDDIFDVC
ncbi:tetratricopeptide repeat protein [Laceyella sacchari]|jgi:tetratricopeptide (TPR) repeat protein|uniref:helix-turn-helix domain-containing protein n=1 Tax=Laceyella sacchari TaxID=37482 RepID=UPI0003B73DC6|nr:helix-turn-helix transcriptional regulator [Laceyella sacchari]TCW40759.1 tetratricopeptide repeat protein [Laceyella sacchari]